MAYNNNNNKGGWDQMQAEQFPGQQLGPGGTDRLEMGTFFNGPADMKRMGAFVFAGSACCCAFVLLVTGAVMVPLGASNLAVSSSLDASADFSDLGATCRIVTRTLNSLSETSTDKNGNSYNCYDIYKYEITVPDDSKTYIETEKLHRGGCTCEECSQLPGTATFKESTTVQCWKPTRDVSQYMDFYGCATESCVRLWSPIISLEKSSALWSVIQTIGIPFLVVGLIASCCASGALFWACTMKTVLTPGQNEGGSQPFEPIATQSVANYSGGNYGGNDNVPVAVPA
mmetsp:Transcript_53073/g.126260  ORF Transcript_53073/g.126260 Transcript_53073/m.126260 type:complete len:286 (+) Transcript_53073:330-1187(+)